jgi:hypothetical protein
VHVVPHAPQFAPSLVVSTHAPEQSVRPVPQPLVEHAPDEQTSPVAHAFAQLPQFAGSLPVSTQAPPQSIVPAGQVHAEVAQV